MTEPTRRFSGRVEAYIRSRPSYPPEVIDTLRAECGLTPRSVIADVGAGTGILSKLFLESGNHVYAVEPNPEMRAAAEQHLRDHQGFECVNGRAEATELPDRSADFVAAGQAFHWFDRDLARREFGRILVPGGWVALVWNDRDLDSSAFMRAYEDLLQRFGTDYHQVDHKIDAEALMAGFFDSGRMKSATYANHQVFDYAGLEGRLRSTSYVPGPTHQEFEPMIGELTGIFDEHAQDGAVVFNYVTRLYYGRLT